MRLEGRQTDGQVQARGRVPCVRVCGQASRVAA